MQSLLDAVLESWDRQSNAVVNVAAIINPELYHAKAGENEWSIGEHLCHIHGTRLYWLSQAAPQFTENLPSLYRKEGDTYIPTEDLGKILKALQLSAVRIREAMAKLLLNPERAGPYDHPLFFLEHMIWHEGWHVGAIMRTLRDADAEPSDEWEELNLWAQWRDAEV